MNTRFINESDFVKHFSFSQAVDAIEKALVGGLDPSFDMQRSIQDIAKGQLLLMPSTSQAGSGVKVITIAPENFTIDQPRIQGLYLLFDKENLATTSIIDGAVLTKYRTPAVSIAAVRRYLPSSSNISIVVYGAGPQGIAHIQTLFEVMHNEQNILHITFVVRDIEKAKSHIADSFLSTLKTDCKVDIHTSESEEEKKILESADVVIAATVAREPLFDSTRLKNSVIVIAIGSHESQAREIDSNFVSRAQVIVETRSSALREAGDIIMALTESDLQEEDLIEIADIVCNRVKLDTSKPILFKSTGMSWEDLVIARELEESLSATTKQ